MGPLSNGKFYVLDRTLASGDLEEFDPKTESWTPLPPPPIVPIGACAERFEEKLDDYEVLSYAIVEDQILFSTRKGIYALSISDTEGAKGFGTLQGDAWEILTILNILVMEGV
ncbi:hypothetical protein RHGRI_012608 [Rhododendron griersonianum]|uniref:F-box/kelch-repeat protein n=1 Tax=Rhododendron griersonianum TaxID=479676 RepID=A0AAV6KSE1_9ERIC|nr:hypothetical protein RHGRI_012608 [Rhododendron griersonianum]